jgi:fucose 4-O-acetylase-like acetyltransferase
MTAAPRLDWVDHAKGLGILLVVYGHVQRGVVNAGLGEGPLLAWVDYAIYTFHMPLFFLLSGLFLGRSMERGAGSFLKTRLVTLAYPYVLWSLIQGGIQIVLSGSLNESRGVEVLTRIPWEPLGQFWFLYALFWGHLLLFPLRRRPVALALVAVGALGARAFLPGVLGQVAFALPYLVAGMVLGGSGVLQSWSEGTADPLRALVLPLLVAVFALAVWLGGPLSAMDTFAWPSFPATLAGVAVILALSMVLTGPAWGWLRLLGRASMVIFILHIIAGSGIRVILLKLGIDSLPLHLVAGCALGVLAPLAAHWLLGRFGLLPWLGLGTRTSRAKV